MENLACTYALEMETPLGRRRGTLKLTLRGGSVSGELTLFARTAPILDGHRRGNSLSFRGEMKTLAGALPYQANGILRDNGLEIKITTARGHYTVRGLRTEKRRG